MPSWLAWTIVVLLTFGWIAGALWMFYGGWACYT